MYLLLSALLVIVTNIVTYSVTKEKMRLKYRKKKQQEFAERWRAYENGEEGLNAEEIAAKRINEALPIDKIHGCFRPYKLAQLVVEHEDGRVTVEDHHLIDDEGESFTLSDFREDDRNVDWVLQSYKCLESITANSLHEVVGGSSKEFSANYDKYSKMLKLYKDGNHRNNVHTNKRIEKKLLRLVDYYSNSINQIARFSDFYDTVNNCIGGRHGKDKIKVKDAFVVFTDLSRYQLSIIANPTDDDIFNKQFNSLESLKYTRDMKDHKKKRREVEFEHERNMLEGVVNMINKKIDKIDNGILGQAMRTAEELAVTKLPVQEVIELPGDNMKSPELSQEEVEDILNNIPENKIFRVKDDIENILEKLTEAGYDTLGVTSVDSLIVANTIVLGGNDNV